MEIFKSKNNLLKEPLKSGSIGPIWLRKFAFILCLVILVMLSIGIYFRLYKDPAYFYAKNQDDTLTPLVALNQPNLTTSALLRWTINAITLAFTMDFYNYQENIASVRNYFTQAGYDNFLNALEKQGIISEIREKNLVLNSVVTDPPIVINEGMITTGFYAWQLQIPMLLTYQGPSEIIPVRILVTALITRVPTNESEQGVGIASFNVVERTTS